MKHFTCDGNVVFRTAGSHGPADVIVLTDNGIVVVQCKRTSKKFSIAMYSEDLERMALIPNLENMTKILWVYSVPDKTHHICTLGE